MCLSVSECVWSFHKQLHLTKRATTGSLKSIFMSHNAVSVYSLKQQQKEVMIISPCQKPPDVWVMLFILNKDTINTYILLHN